MGRAVKLSHEKQRLSKGGKLDEGTGGGGAGRKDGGLEQGRKDESLG